MSFLKKLQSQEQEKRKDIVRKLEGDGVLYMGDPALHWGVGGWARGKLNLMYGPEKSGKSTITLKAAAEEQKRSGGAVVIFDSEYVYSSFNDVDEDGNLTQDSLKVRDRMTKMGLDVNNVYVFSSNEPNILFKELGAIEKAIKSGEDNISVIIIDSLGALQSSTAADKMAAGDIVGAANSYGGIAKIIAQLSLTFTRISNEYGITCLFVQHCIANMDQYGPKWLLLGGQKLRFMMHNIVFVESVGSKDAGLLADGTTTGDNADGVRVGKKIRFKCDKSRNLVEGRKGEFWFNFEEGSFAKPEESLFDLATSLGVIDHPKTIEKNKDGTPKLDKKGLPIVKVNNVWWEFPVGVENPHKYQGRKQCIEALAKNKDLYNQVFNECMSSKKSSAIASGETVADVSFGESDD